MTSTQTIKNVAWYGTGRLGLPMLHHVASSNKFNIKLLVRRDPSSYSDLPSNITTTQISLSDAPSLTATLSNIDAVVVFTSFAPHNDLDIVQLALINASIAAGVEFFVPSEWAPDTAGGNGATLFRIGPETLPPTPGIAMKRVVHNYLLARSGEGKIRFATVHAGNMLTNLQIFSKISLGERTATLPDGGIHPFSLTSKATLGAALVNLLSLYPTIKNEFLYICDGETTMLDVVQALGRVSSSPDREWGITSYSIAERKRVADENMKAGKMGLQEFSGLLSVPFTGGLTVWKNPDNERLGLEAPSKERARGVVEAIVKEVAKDLE